MPLITMMGMSLKALSGVWGPFVQNCAISFKLINEFKDMVLKNDSSCHPLQLASNQQSYSSDNTGCSKFYPAMAGMG
jgi:hypothetical protein